MKIRIAVVLIVTLLGAIIIGAWLGGWDDVSPASRARAPKPVVSAPVKIASPAPTPQPSPIIQAATPAPPPPPAIATMAASPQGTSSPSSGDAPPTQPSVDLVADAAVRIDKIGLMFRDYRTLMGSNPVGTNAEIIQSVNGGNPKQAKLGPPDGQQLNARGELIDAWGTAYFFHQKSASDMEIHSAGADKQFGTSDDIIGR